MEHSGSTVALEFIDYDVNLTSSFDNSLCSISLEQQEDDSIRIREGKKTSGFFYPMTEPINLDGTYKRIVYSQIKEIFYNNYRDPLKMWGMETLDFETSETKRFISDQFRLYDIPVIIYGQKILENSLNIQDSTTDNNYSIKDDGNGNLFAFQNLFSKQQEVGNFENEFLTGSINNCSNYF